MIGLDIIAAGAHAVIIHGYPRNTFDLDLTVVRDDRAKWLALPLGLGYVVFREGSTFLQLKRRRRETELRST